MFLELGYTQAKQKQFSMKEVVAFVSSLCHGDLITPHCLRCHSLDFDLIQSAQVICCTHCSTTLHMIRIMTEISGTLSVKRPSPPLLTFLVSAAVDDIIFTYEPFSNNFYFVYN